jgi:bifunctional NMN adenylyltransferase/nudix hydrolase
MKTGIVIGRFQTDVSHAGHALLIDEVNKNSDQLVIVIGESPLCLTSRNPLSLSLRVDMIKEEYPEADVLTLKDNPSDEKWSENLDKLLEKYDNVTLFGSRDCFFPHYHGKHNVCLVATMLNKSSTERREKIANLEFKMRDVHKPSFRKGIIYAVENRFPTAFPTVDIALLKWNNTDFEDVEILLGRKPNRETYCIIGGFVDPKDSSFEAAAARELSEEVQGIQTHEFTYIGSTKIDDFRYRGTKDGIITSLFTTFIMGGTPRAADDIEEVKWFLLKDIDMTKISDYHHPLIEMIQKHLQKKKTFKVKMFDDEELEK